MKPFLLFRDKDFDLQQELPSNESVITQDLELNTLFRAMAFDDDFSFEVVRKVVISGSIDINTILWRQNVLKDCLKYPSIIKDIYFLVNEALITQKKNWLSVFSFYPSSVVSSAIALLRMLLDVLKKLRQIADEHADKFESDGFTAFFRMLKTELNDEYFAIIENHFKELAFKDGIIFSAGLRKGNESTDYILRKPEETNASWAKRLFGKKPRSYAFYAANRLQRQR